MANVRHQEILNKVTNFLRENEGVGFSRDEIAKSISEPTTGTWRALKQLDSHGLLNIESIRSPQLYSWKKGAIPTIAPVLKFVEENETESSLIQANFNGYVKGFQEDKPDPQPPFPATLVLAALASLDSREHDEIVKRNEWLDLVLTDLRQWYIAYRIIETIKATPDKSKLAKMFGLHYTTPTEMDIREYLRIMRPSLLNGLKTRTRGNG